MAETRTHDPKDRDELDRALREALGDPIRPVPAGSSHTPKAKADTPDPKPGFGSSLPQQSVLDMFAMPTKPAPDPKD
ncbi:MAG: hypothetical protein GX875_03845 [Propionibacterium sp.]|nr:hypothetical protein [Propionibacterium sp.]